MKQRALCLVMLLLLLALPVLSACTGGESALLLIYMCGSDLESEHGYASANIEEMLSAKLPRNLEVVLQTGGAERWHSHGIPADSLCRYTVEDGELRLLERLPSASMGEEDTLASFLTFAANYEAENVSLILWDHGGGSVAGVCADELFGGDALTLRELDAALTRAGLHFEMVGLDACLMATYDTALALAPHADRMIASQDLEPAEGWDYSSLLSAVAQEDYGDILAAYAEKHSGKPYTLSLTDLTRTDALTAAVGELGEAVKRDLASFSGVMDASMKFGTQELGVRNSMADLGSIAENLGVPLGLAGVLESVGGASRASASGLSIYFPCDGQDLQAYAPVCMDERYRAFLEDYYSVAPAEPVSFLDRGSDLNGRYTVILQPESLNYLQSAYYDVHIADQVSEGKMYSIGCDKEFDVSNAVYTVRFDGVWAYFDGNLLHCSIYERREGYTRYFAPVLVNGAPAHLLFTYSDGGGIRIEGYLEHGSSRIAPLTYGSTITTLYADVSADGDLFESGAYVEEGTLEYNPSSAIAIAALPAGYYQIVPHFVDIYGNIYTAYTALYYFDGTASRLIDITAG